MANRPDVLWADQPVWKSIDCGPGWWPIIAQLDAELRERFPDYRATQIKEKFGTLRYYVIGVPNSEYWRIQQAEEATARTCELCGQEGSLRDDRRWIRTLCDEDAAARPTEE